MTGQLDTYLKEDTLPLPFCPGCGHHTILKALDQALVQLQLGPEEVVIVTDIGCAGLSDKYFRTHAFHGLHGRSATYATGIKLARPDLTVIVLIGDGGFGIGGHHLLNAARRNLGIKVVVFNNFNYGMTGGEHSVTTPPGARTATTPAGNLERPLDIAQSVGVNGANFAARTSTFDSGLPDLIARAISHPGFSLVDIWELCTAYFVPHNKFTRRKLEETLQNLNFETGVLFEADRPEYSRTYRESLDSGSARDQVMVPEELEAAFQSELEQQTSLVIAGAAGAKIVTAGTLFSQGAILSGLQAAQRADYPVTVKTGHSLAEVILSPEEILYPGSTTPDVVLALFPEGLQQTAGVISKLPRESLLIMTEDLPLPETSAETWQLDFSSAQRWGRKQEYRALMALAVYLRERGLYPVEALQAAVNLNIRYAEENLAAIQASIKIDIQVQQVISR